MASIIAYHVNTSKALINNNNQLEVVKVSDLKCNQKMCKFTYNLDGDKHTSIADSCQAQKLHDNYFEVLSKSKLGRNHGPTWLINFE